MERHRIYSDGTVYFVTFSVVEWLPVFVSDLACGILAESFNFCHAKKHLRVNAYVIMPTHIHAILFDADFDVKRFERTLWDLRKYTGRQLSDFSAKHSPACFSDVLRDAAGEDRQRQFWQPSRHPVQIETERFWKQKLDYMHDNPCRKGLVARAEHWRFSSASYWLSDGRVPNEVILTGLDW